MEPPDQPHTEREAALMMEIAAEKRENAKLREHVANLLPYAHMLSRGTAPIAAYADLLPYVIADAEAAIKP